MRQIALPVQPVAEANFDEFIVGDNRDVVSVLRSDEYRVLHLFAPPSSGKTHLMKALAAELADAWYFSVAELSVQQQEGLLDALSSCQCLILDDIDAGLGSDGFEHRLFDWINYCRAQDVRLVTTSKLPVADLPIQLVDLRTRLQWAQVLQLLPLPAEEMPRWLQHCAETLGLEVSEAVATYILSHGSRDCPQLLAMLSEVAAVAKGGQRRLTIPYVKGFIPK